MTLPRRRFLGSSLFLLGNTLTEALATPLWKWKDPALLQAAVAAPTQVAATPDVQFVDVAQKAGLTVPNVWGGIDHKRSIIEAKGSGLAFFDYDNDGWLDIYLTNGNRLDAKWPKGQEPTSHLYKNNRDGTFTDVTQVWPLIIRVAGRVCRGLRQRWQGRSVRYILGPQQVVSQQRKRHFYRSDAKSGGASGKGAGKQGARSSIMTAMASSISLSATYVDLGPDKIRPRGSELLPVEGRADHVWPARAARRYKICTATMGTEP